MADKQSSKFHKAAGSGIIVCLALLIGILLFTIISEPDEGGIWDGYVPTWLGGEGPGQ